MILVGYVERMGKRTVGCKVLVGNPEGKEILVRPSRRGEDNIEMDPQ
jgi:hypothetical protein